ncbi:MAG: phosphoserine transaminase [Sphingomonadales bacterium]|nr:phosphoserine transaminase [Sphingomonadales bacterium]PIX66676.1 MAG: phosphoserine transaminase [Sphingomonadales bacterium CG_4_10_14_3_um_filter_58_15]NCO48496.1 phosphoserine transaminase [Sphingomonadales bacterium]NCO99312.1 phosphoserine transaminase [Sphingomonadales bacterium]NCP27871.1 phosphoserine transaminase [Sphingomonadales bacterium]
MTDTTIPTPELRPDCPNFSSGPTAKFPGWSLDKINTIAMGRSHRSATGKARLKYAIDLSRELLGIPDDYLIGIVPASDTGAVELAMWNMLGARPVTVAAWESFGNVWIQDAVKQLKLDNLTVLDADYGEIPDLTTIDKGDDIVFTWNGTTSGAKIPDTDWIADDREGVTINDATSAVFAQPMDWAKLDATTYSWQKVMGSEAGHGMLILSPRAVERIESYSPSWPLPKIFRVKKGDKLNTAIFEGATINTPSMLATEDYITSLEWAKSIGGLPELHARADRNAQIVHDWIAATPWMRNMVSDPAKWTNTGVCMVFQGDWYDSLDDDTKASVPKKIAGMLEKMDVAYDFNGYRDAPPSLRIWCGSTVEEEDIRRLLSWIEWAFAQVKSELS